MNTRRWSHLLEAGRELWREYTLVTRAATIALVLACLFGISAVMQGDDAHCLLPGLLCGIDPAWHRALSSDAFRSLLALAIALFVAIHLKERQIEGLLDGSQHYDIGRALAYGYFTNFLVPALVILREQHPDKVLRVIEPANVQDLTRFTSEIWPRVRERVRAVGLDAAWRPGEDAPVRRSMLVLGEADAEYFDFPTTLFTVHDYYARWNDWLREEGKAPMVQARITELQERQIRAFFQHLDQLSRSEIGVRAVADLKLDLQLADLRELFARHFRTIKPAEFEQLLRP